MEGKSEKKMKLIEAMKTLKILEKKIQHNTQRINEYAAIVSTERPIFGTEEEQRKQVESLIQANIDLGKEYLRLKKLVDLTNIRTMVQIGKESYSISDLLQIKRSVGGLMRSTFAALNDNYAEKRMAMVRLQTAEKPPHVERMYNESKKYEGMQFWQGLMDEIETRIEVINATTDLVE